MDYFISDTHFNDPDVLKYAIRPWDDVKVMNDAIIHNWNMTVSEDDTVYHVGDVGFDILDIIPDLPGNKILIKGNHDRFEDEYYKKAGFDTIINGGLIYKEFYLVTHKPLFMNEHMPYINIHGDIHQNELKGDKYINVCVEILDYGLISFDKIQKRSGWR